MDITGTTFHFTQKVTEEENTSSPENPADGDKEKSPKAAGDRNKKGGQDDKDKKNGIGAFAYDMIKTGIQQTLSAVTSSVSGSPTLQIQLQAAQQVGGKIIAYTTAAVSGNWAALATMAITDVISYGTKKAAFERDKAWSDYDLEQYRERRGYSTMRSRK